MRLAGIRPTHTSAVLIACGQLPAQMIKIINLPQDERVKASLLLVALLGVANKRRRERSCAAEYTHAWHQPVRNRHGGSGQNRKASSRRLRQ
ncbi:DUF5958 family protein [Streptomyces canus]|uniref:DUF5958 family protein n=1 Tax=Streptomyces canus TaxID=58343 RepID=UPI00386A3174